jgi:alpha-glucosidase
MGNHDQHRVASRVGTDQARVANMMLLTLRGTPTTYYGEEIGMENVDIPLEFIQDPPAVNQPEIAHIVGRDPERTPMQWDDSPNAGFAPESVTPWLPVAIDYTSRNVKQQEMEPDSMLQLYRALSAIRWKEAALSVGDYTSVESGHKDVFAYRRDQDGADSFIVVLNFGGQAVAVDLSEVAEKALVAVSTTMAREGYITLADLQLDGNEGLVLRLNRNQ